MHHSSTATTETVLERLYEAAADLGRLRRILNPEPGSLVEWRVDQLAGHLEVLIGCYELTAADIVAHAYPGDDACALAALELVDRRHAHLRRTLGHKAAA